MHPQRAGRPMLTGGRLIARFAAKQRKQLHAQELGAQRGIQLLVAGLDVAALAKLRGKRRAVGGWRRRRGRWWCGGGGGTQRHAGSSPLNLTLR